MSMRLLNASNSTSARLVFACNREPVVLCGSHIRKQGRKPVSAASGSAINIRATLGCTMRCTARRRPYSVEWPSPARVRLIGLPCHRSLKAASVFCLFSLFIALPPRNCPPSSENRPRLRHLLMGTRNHIP